MELGTIKFTILLLSIGIQVSIQALGEFGTGPLLTGATSFTFVVSTTTLTKPTPCFVTSGVVSQCRRRRGLEEQPEIIQFDDSQIAPSSVSGVETTPAPLMRPSSYNAERIVSSFGDSNYYNSLNVFRQLAAKGRNNMITIGDCGKSTINFIQFFSCLGLTVQETTTLTATFTETQTLSTGFIAFTVNGCTPHGFPYMHCPYISTSTPLNTYIPYDTSILETVPNYSLNPTEPISILLDVAK